MRLDAEDIEAVAQRVAHLLATTEPAGEPADEPVRLLDAAQLARTLGVRRDWVYRHAGQLGGIRLGGPGGRLRFDLQQAHSLLDGQAASPQGGRPLSRPGRPRPPAGFPVLDARRDWMPRASRAIVAVLRDQVAGRRTNAPGRDTGGRGPPMYGKSSPIARRCR